VNGWNPGVSILLGMLVGAAAGLVTATLHHQLRLNVLIAGIVVSTGAYSICLMIMGTGNVPLLGESTIFTWATDRGMTYQHGTILVGAIVSVVFASLLVLFLKTTYGLSLRATGENIQTARGLGIRTERRQVVGLMIANALAACSGGLVVESEGFMDVTIQVNVIVIGLAALMIGLGIVRTPKVLPAVAAVVLGVLVYRIIVSWALDIGLNPNYLQLTTAALVIAVIGVRTSARRLWAIPGTSSARRARIDQLRFYEEDRVASFL
jgi:putative ABC transport system permease protein